MIATLAQEQAPLAKGGGTGEDSIPEPWELGEERSRGWSSSCGTATWHGHRLYVGPLTLYRYGPAGEFLGRTSVPGFRCHSCNRQTEKSKGLEAFKEVFGQPCGSDPVGW